MIGIRAPIGTIRVKPAFRNCGSSWGLEYPWIFGPFADLGYAIWDRHSGEIATIIRFDTSPGWNDWQKRYRTEQRAIRLSRAMNGLPPMDRSDPEVNAAHDETP